MQDFRNVSIMSYSESWLKGTDQNEHVAIDGFKLIQGDRILENTEKKIRGRCVCLHK